MRSEPGFERVGASPSNSRSVRRSRYYSNSLRVEPADKSELVRPLGGKRNRRFVAGTNSADPTVAATAPNHRSCDAGRRYFPPNSTRFVEDPLIWERFNHSRCP